MSKIKFKRNGYGVRAILKSSEVQSLCQEEADKMASAAGPGYVSEPRNYAQRSGAAVYPSNADAWRDNLKNNTLEKVIRNVRSSGS